MICLCCAGSFPSSETVAKEVVGVFGKEEKLNRTLQFRALTWWTLLLITMLGLCVLWAPLSAAAQSSAHCSVYVEKLDNIHSLAERTTNELGRAFTEKLAEMYTLADQSCQAHIKGNAYFEEGSPRADFEYQKALNLDKQILGKIGAVVPTFGVTAEGKAKLEEAQRLYSQQVNFYAQSNQLSAQAGMAYRIGNRTVGDRLLDRANSANDSANQLEDRAFALLEEVAELLCQLPEQSEAESVPRLGEATTAIALTPPEGEYVEEVLIEECPECPREQGGPAETTNQGIQVPTPIFGVSKMLFDQVTDCETGEEIDPALLQTEFVFTSGAQTPYDLSKLEKVILSAEGYEDRQILDFTPMQLGLGFIQFTVLAPREQDICLTKEKKPSCKCIDYKEKKKLTLIADLSTPTSADSLVIEIPSGDADRVPIIKLPCGVYMLEVDEYTLEYPCGCCQGDKCESAKEHYTPQTASLTVKKNDESQLTINAYWSCVGDVFMDCDSKFCDATYWLRYRGLGAECECGGVGFLVTVTNDEVGRGNPTDSKGTGASGGPLADTSLLGPRRMGTKEHPRELSLTPEPSYRSIKPLKWYPGDTLVITVRNIRSNCWCCNEYKDNDGCEAKAATKTDRDKHRAVTMTYKSSKFITVDKKGWDTDHPVNYEFKVEMKDPEEKVAYLDFEVSYKCYAKSNAETCKDGEDTCKEYFRILLGQPAPLPKGKKE